jgi:dipeptidyl aminopeptidase/acylaminoacyl peptidase
MRRRWTLLFALVLALPLAPARAEAPARDHDITLDDYFTQATPLEAVPSPDGKYVAYADGRWQESSDDRKADLWLAESATGKVRRLTFERVSARALQWAPDGRHVYFAANRKREGEKQPPLDGKTQVWRVALGAGLPLAVTRVESGVASFQLAGDGRSLYYVTEGTQTQGEWKQLREQFKDLDYGHGVTKLSRIWKLDLESWRAEKVVDEKRFIHEMALAPDGRRLAMITAPDDKVVSFEGRSRVDIHDFKTGKTTALPDRLWRADAPSPYGWLEKLAWSPQGTALAFNVIFDGFPAEIILADWDGEQVTTSRLRRPPGLSVKGYGSPLQWRGSAELCFLGEEKARVRLYSVGDVRGGKHGEARVWTPGDVVVESFRFNASGGRAALLQSDPTHLTDIHLIEGPSKSRPLTRLNPQADSWKLPRLSVVSWKGAHGDPVEGVLELPPGYQEGQRLPLVVEIHGGPTTATYYQLQYWIYGRTLLPARGYAVLSPNYRGSTGYGDKFLTDLVGHENGIEVEDILKGVDALVERGIADPERLGVMGWSNGGYLTNCLITTTTRFKAASSGAGIVDTVMEWGANDEPAYAISFKQGFPWNKAETYKRTSPTYRLDKIRTPTLIHVGGGDERCPPGHSRMLYRALKEYVRVPTELIVYPGEPHGLMKYKNRKAKMAWDLAWFDRHLLGKRAEGGG